MPDPAILFECPWCNGQNWPDQNFTDDELCVHCGEPLNG